MRTDILDLENFYRTPLGRQAQATIAGRLVEAWGEAAGLDVAGFGFATPFLNPFTGARRRLALAPGGQGVTPWPASAPNAACLVGERFWPLPDASLDRVLVVHGLEESPDPQRLMREIWRVLSDDGRVIIVAAHRRGLWSMVETTPFAAGRPYLKRQLERLLTDAMFKPAAWSSVLYFPPSNWRFLLRAAAPWERAGGALWPAFGGVLMVEAAKEMLVPASVVRSIGARARVPAAAAVRPSTRDVRPRACRAGSPTVPHGPIAD